MVRNVLLACALLSAPLVRAAETNGWSVAAANADWMAATCEKDVLPGSALDFTALRLQDAPAGKYGFVRVKGDHFVFEKRPDVPCRFYGANLCFDANYPDHATADRLAARFAAMGYNAIRIHHYDGALVRVADGRMELDPEMADRLDYFAAKLIEKGIYLTTDLYVSRKIPWRTFGIDRDGKCPFKAMVHFHEGAYANWCEFARLFLTHVNPYTKRAWGCEPALTSIVLVNEGLLYSSWPTIAKEPWFAAAYRAWSGGQEPPPDFKALGEKKSAVYARFLADTEARTVARMKKFLREDLGCPMPVSNQNCGPHLPAMQQTREDVYDYVDDHTYVDHPKFVGPKKWTPPVKLSNGGSNQLAGSCCALTDLAFTRLVDKPFVASEWNWSYPGTFRAQGALMMGAMAALQDWDGLYRFAYAHKAAEFEEKPMRMEFFNIATDPVMLAGERAAILLFLRRDLAPHAKSVARMLDDAALRPTGTNSPALKPGWQDLIWKVRAGSCVPGHCPPDAVAIPYAAKKGDVCRLAKLDKSAPCAVTQMAERGALSVVTPLTCAGYAEEGRVDAGALAFAVRRAPAAVSAHSLDGAPIGASRHLLVTHVTDAVNAGGEFSDATRSRMEKWGKGNVLVRVGEADVELAVPKGGACRVWALNASGKRLGGVPCVRKDGRLAFAANVRQGDAPCFYYEITAD